MIAFWARIWEKGALAAQADVAHLVRHCCPAACALHEGRTCFWEYKGEGWGGDGGGGWGVAGRCMGLHAVQADVALLRCLLLLTH